MVMKYDSIMADWLGGSGEHQPGRAGARTATGQHSRSGAAPSCRNTVQISLQNGNWQIQHQVQCKGVSILSITPPPVSPCCAGWWCRVMRAGWARCWAGAPPRPVMSIVKCNNAVTCTGPADTAYSATFYNTTLHNTTQH